MLLNDALGLAFRQAEVDFVIPDTEQDLQLYVDPFLFYKSGNPAHQAVHSVIHNFFDTAISQVREGNPDIAKRMLDFPEVHETMLGLSSTGHKGKGLGNSRGDIIYRELVSNPEILSQGVRHLAQMQLLIEGVGFDMVSDMCTNIAKPFFIDYTQRQCALHDIPMEKGVCLQHVFDWDELDWDDKLLDLPVNPANGYPILLVPKTVVRQFDDINYKDFWNSTYRYILRDIEVQKSLASIGRVPKITWKEINKKYNFCKKTVVDVLHEKPELLDNYLTDKENQPVRQVDLGQVKGTDQVVTSVQSLIDELNAIKPGNAHAKRYEAYMVRVFTLLFSPPLIDPHSQVTSFDGREIIDITFYNDSQFGFWHDVKTKHDSLITVVELKNMNDLANEEYFQISARLNDKRGKFGLLVARNKDNLDIQRAYRRLNDERKVILTLTDEDIIAMLKMVETGLNPTVHITKLYRRFMEES